MSRHHKEQTGELRSHRHQALRVGLWSVAVLAVLAFVWLVLSHYHAAQREQTDLLIRRLESIQPGTSVAPLPLPPLVQGTSRSLFDLPDLPEGWSRGGPLAILVLVVLIFLFFLSAFLRGNAKRENAREENLARLHIDHAERIRALADSLAAQHQATMDRQLAHCKEEVEATASGYRGQVEIMEKQNQSLVAIIDRKLAEARCRWQECGGPA